MTYCVDAEGQMGRLCAFVPRMIGGVVGDIANIFTCVQYKIELFVESFLLQTSRDQNKAFAQKESLND